MASSIPARPVVAEKVSFGDLGQDVFRWRWAGIPVLLLSLFYLGVRWYEGVYAWSAGLDAFAPEFQTYWMNVLYIEEPLLALIAVGIVSYLYKNRERNPEMVEMQPREELRRIMVVFAMAVLYGVSVFWALSFFTEQDATWHQTVIRDSDFTPSHIIEFYLSYPIYIIIALTGFMYARTKIPYFMRAYSLPWLIFFMGPFLVFPNVGFNEWGHTFWIQEELFTAPLHWGFVILGWLTLAFFGVARQLLNRIGELASQAGTVDAMTMSDEEISEEENSGMAPGEVAPAR